MNSRFDKYLKTLASTDDEATAEALNDLHRSFATLSQEEQRFAYVLLGDILSGETAIEVGESFRDYITAYQERAKTDQIKKVATIFGLDEAMLRELLLLRLTEATINRYERLDKLVATVDKAKAKAYFERVEGGSVSAFAVSSKVYALLRDFLLKGGCDFVEEGYSAK